MDHWNKLTGDRLGLDPKRRVVVVEARDVVFFETGLPPPRDLCQDPGGPEDFAAGGFWVDDFVGEVLGGGLTL